MLREKVSFSRRFNSRVQTTDDLWAYWHYKGRAEVNRVRGSSHEESGRVCERQ